MRPTWFSLLLLLLLLLPLCNDSLNNITHFHCMHDCILSKHTYIDNISYVSNRCCNAQTQNQKNWNIPIWRKHIQRKKIKENINSLFVPIKMWTYANKKCTLKLIHRLLCGASDFNMFRVIVMLHTWYCQTFGKMLRDEIFTQ